MIDNIAGYAGARITEYLVEQVKKFALQEEIVTEVFAQVKTLAVILSAIMFGAGAFAGFIIGVLFTR